MSRYLPIVARILMGLVFFGAGLFGLMIALKIMAPPPQNAQPPAATAFFNEMVQSGYLLLFVKLTETTIGILLLANRFVPLALAIIAPIVLNIFAFHAVLAPSGLPLAILLVVLESYLAWAYRDAYRPMLAARVTPHAK